MRLQPRRLLAISICAVAEIWHQSDQPQRIRAGAAAATPLLQGIEYLRALSKGLTLRL